MADIRHSRVADILVDYSLAVKKDELVEIAGDTNSQDLLLAIYRKVLEKGAIPKLNTTIDRQNYYFYKYAPKK